MTIELPREATNEVHVRGETLSRVLWKGRQWAVTTYGLECRDGTYAIAASRLSEGMPEYPWDKHMADKNWVEMGDFRKAFAVALHLHAGSSQRLRELRQAAHS